MLLLHQATLVSGRYMIGAYIQTKTHHDGYRPSWECRQIRFRDPSQKRIRPEKILDRKPSEVGKWRSKSKVLTKKIVKFQ